ncbi:hypothetical protein ACFY9W_19885, partial [Pseudomonas sp. NPDC008258]
SPAIIKAHKRPLCDTVGAFLCPAVSFYGGCAWGASVRAGFLDSRLTNPRTVATHSFGHVVWRLQ